MNGGFGMKKHLMHVSNPQECSLCKQIFFTPQDLISHYNTFHSNYHVPTTFRHHYPYPNCRGAPYPALPGMNRFDLNYHRSGRIDEQRRFCKGFPANTPANYSNFMQQEKPKLMNLFPAMSSECTRTLPLLCQLEQRGPQETVTEKDWAISSPIDLTLRL
ncbi:unnamed protein product [Eruca vesicaria subsp. sativa]|uniref:C2H2-type domain-containing protein n=1 Tax=Eruca vesicaria subsp. sativa TaxID=29727 RepID=A0ABC8IUV4_ERUVS|nr:unnamed protein product [Eruca vesicaria subsp. sativa]